MRRRLADEQGIAIVIAIVLLGLMMSAGLASYAYVDTGQEQSRVERVDESTFNLGEGLLNHQAFILSRMWPRTAARTYPACTAASADPQFCPQPASIEASYDGVDYRTGSPTWVTSVRDDTGSAFYDVAEVSARPAYDENGNDKVWVRAQATYTVGPDTGRTRTLVALVQVERIPVAVQFPERTLIAGKFAVSNSGNQTYVQTRSTQTSPHPVTLRCSPAAVNSPHCANYNRDGQIQPPGSIETGYVGQSALSTQMQDALREKAITDGTYYATTCPASLTGEVVWVESATCDIQNNANSMNAPGITVFGSGKLTISRNRTFYGVVYMLNRSNSTDFDVFVLHANSKLVGRVFVDGGGGVTVGSSKENLWYEDFKDAPLQMSVYGTAGVVQNSWREIVSAN